MNRIFKLLRLISTKKLIFFLCLFFLLSFFATFGELISTYLISNYISSSLYTDFYISNRLNYFVLNPQFIFLNEHVMISIQVQNLFEMRLLFVKRSSAAKIPDPFPPCLITAPTKIVSHQGFYLFFT